MRMFVPVAAASLLASAAFAQPATTQQPPGGEAHPQVTNPMIGHASLQHASLQQAIRGDLQKAGFTDVRVMPDSFLVQAKDRAGNPVTMIVGPTSMTAVVQQSSSNTTNDPAGGNDSTTGTNHATGMTSRTGANTVAMNNTTGTANDASNNGETASMFTTVPNTDRLSSEIVGLDVYNNANQDIGTIKDIAYTRSRVQAYIVAVGGFLGLGDHYVAVDPSDVKVTYDANAKKWHARMDATADQLKSAPAFTYPSKT